MNRLGRRDRVGTYNKYLNIGLASPEGLRSQHNREKNLSPYTDDKLLELLEEFRKMAPKKKNLKSPRVVEGKNRKWIINNIISNGEDNSTTKKNNSNKEQRKNRKFTVSNKEQRKNRKFTLSNKGQKKRRAFTVSRIHKSK